MGHRHHSDLRLAILIEVGGLRRVQPSARQAHRLRLRDQNNTVPNVPKYRQCRTAIKLGFDHQNFISAITI